MKLSRYNTEVKINNQQYIIYNTLSRCYQLYTDEEKAVLKEQKRSQKDLNIYKCKSLNQAVQTANEIAIKGDIVLFSPASASFDMFKNFAERGEIFKQYVKEIVK